MTNCFCAHLSVILVFISLIALQLGNYKPKISLLWALKLFVACVHMLLVVILVILYEITYPFLNFSGSTVVAQNNPLWALKLFVTCVHMLLLVALVILYEITYPFLNFSGSTVEV